MLEYRHFEPKYVKKTLYCCYSLKITIILLFTTLEEQLFIAMIISLLPKTYLLKDSLCQFFFRFLKNVGLNYSCHSKTFKEFFKKKAFELMPSPVSICVTAHSLRSKKSVSADVNVDNKS